MRPSALSIQDPASQEDLPDGMAELLTLASEGRPGAQDKLFGLLYDELHLQAQRCMPRGKIEHTLRPTALVNEAYLRLCKGKPGIWQDEHHFLKTAAQAMRHILVDYARRKDSLKRQKGNAAVPLEDIAKMEFEERAYDMEKLDLALSKLAEFDPEMAHAVELRFFGGVSQQETAKMLHIPQRTLERRWSGTRAWLYKEIHES